MPEMLLVIIKAYDYPSWGVLRVEMHVSFAPQRVCWQRHAGPTKADSNEFQQKCRVMNAGLLLSWVWGWRTARFPYALAEDV